MLRTRASSLCFPAIAAAALVVCAPAFAQYLVKTDADLQERRSEPVDRMAPLTTAPMLNPICGPTALAWLGQVQPGGGSLTLISSTATMNASGQIAFFALINGWPRNQGIFTAAGSSLTPIAIGCGGLIGSNDPGTGCGNPTPIGGTFGGFEMSSPPGVPAINDAGDVLFLADVDGGSSTRALFLYRGASGLIEKVAALGDSASGLPITALGSGSLNNLGEVVFLAAYAPANDSTFIVHWRDGVLRKVVAPGDPSPMGGAFSHLAWWGSFYEDGAYYPTFQTPDINDRGTIAFMALHDGGSYPGLFVSRDGVHEKYVGYGDSTPVGSSFFWLWGAVLNNNDEMAFFGEYLIDPWLAGWFVGRPGQWRHVLSFLDPIDGGQAWGLAPSHNPMQPLDDEGNLIVWVDVKYTEAVSIPQVLLGHSDGTLETLVKSGNATPFGGSLGPLGPWPSLLGRRCSLEAIVRNSPLGEAQMQLLRRPKEVSELRVARDAGPGIRLTWDMQESPPGAGMTFDVLRGRLSGLVPPVPTECAAANVVGTALVEAQAACPAPPGDGCWYLVRAQDACGSGPYGSGQTVCFDACEGSQIPGCHSCGDGILHSGFEECDGTLLGLNTCESLNYDGGTIACSSTCHLDTSGCTTTCGNGIIRGDEECDGANLGGSNCPYLGYDSGVLSCTSGCAYDLSGCCCTDGTPGCPACPVCGNGVREAPYELCDGPDLGGETCWSQGHLPGDLLCKHTCDAFIYTGCTGALRSAPPGISSGL